MISALLVVASILVTRETMAATVVTCMTDADCGIAGETCQMVTGLDCPKGKCFCAKGTGYNADKTECLPNKRLALGDPCVDADFEVHVKSADCFSAVSACSPGYYQVGEKCLYTYGKSCTSDDDCKSDPSVFACSTSTAVCTCDAAHTYYNRECVWKDIADTCSADADCIGLSNGAAGGYTCASGECDCSEGYRAVPVTEIEYDFETGLSTTDTRSYCFASNVDSVFNLTDTTAACTLSPEAKLTSQVSVCSAPDYGCFGCPVGADDGEPAGNCRKIKRAIAVKSTTTTPAPMAPAPAPAPPPPRAPSPRAPIMASSGKSLYSITGLVHIMSVVMLRYSS